MQLHFSTYGSSDSPAASADTSSNQSTLSFAPLRTKIETIASNILLSLSLSLFDESSNDDPYKKTTPWHHYGKFSATETPEHGGSVAASEVSSSARAMQCMRAVCWTTSPFPFAFSQIHIFCILSFVSFFIIEPAVGQTISFTMWTDGSKLYPDNSYGSFKGNGKAACKLLYFHNILKFFFCCETV